MSQFSLELNEDQQQIQQWIHDFAEGVVRPVAAEWDEREETPWPVIEEAANIGLYSFDFFANGFADESGLTIPIALEELFWGDAGIGLSIVGTVLGVAGIMANGTPEQIGEWVPQCFGTPEKLMMSAFCVSEPDAGSDVSSLRTTAVYDEAKDEWVLNGQKTWITNGGIADIHVVVASVDRDLKGRGQASFIVPPGTPGLSQGTKFKKHGIRASHTAEVILDDCRVPGSCLLGGKDKLDERLARAREGKSSKVQAAMATFEATRPSVGAQAVGVARAAYEYALEYAKERKQFGKPIIENQSIAFMLANMKTEIDASRLLGPHGWAATARSSPPPRARCRSSRRAAPRSGSPSGPSRSWAATATSGSTRSSAGTATPRSTTSSKVPSRSRSSSSHERSPACASSSGRSADRQADAAGERVCSQ